MDEHQHHEHLIKEVAEEYKDILENEKQGIYIYLDDTHKLCNVKLAEMLGYESPADWAAVVDNPIGTMVAKSSQKTLIDAFWSAREKSAGSTIEVNWNKKSGGEVKTTVILVPISFQGHIFALHFVSKK